MADLDDFFAKKDRKKGKSTKKYATTEEVAKKLEDPTKKGDKPRKEKQMDGDDALTANNEQDEWKDFEEEKKDYTGLKIGNLQINSLNDATDGNENEPQHDGESGEDADSRRSLAGPWKRMDDEPVAVPKLEPAPKIQEGTYRPPFMRNQQQQPQTLQPVKMRSKVAPDIHNEAFFPTLSRTGDKKLKSDGAFETVAQNKASSYRHQETSSREQVPKLTLENRYNTLSDS